MGGTELEVGAQARAARTLMDAIDPIQTQLTDLGTAIEDAATGFKGAAAGGLVAALKAWFDAASELPPLLGEYAQKLVTVDVTEGGSDSRASESYAKIAGRMGGR